MVLYDFHVKKSIYMLLFSTVRFSKVSKFDPHFCYILVSIDNSLSLYWVPHSYVTMGDNTLPSDSFAINRSPDRSYGLVIWIESWVHKLLSLAGDCCTKDPSSNTLYHL